MTADLRPCAELVQVLRDETQTIQVNTGVVVRIFGQSKPAGEKAVETTLEKQPILFKAPDGVEDTRALVDAEYVSFGSDGTLRWGDLVLQDGTNVKFAPPKPGYHLITSYDWRNLV